MFADKVFTDKVSLNTECFRRDKIGLSFSEYWYVFSNASRTIQIEITSLRSFLHCSHYQYFSVVRDCYRSYVIYTCSSFLYYSLLNSTRKSEYCLNLARKSRYSNFNSLLIKKKEPKYFHLTTFSRKIWRFPPLPNLLRPMLSSPTVIVTCSSFVLICL